MEIDENVYVQASGDSFTGSPCIVVSLLRWHGEEKGKEINGWSSFCNCVCGFRIQADELA